MRPVVRYFGGKWKLAPWIIGHFPEHRIYVEPYGGGGSVLLRKWRCYSEVYNDLDGSIVNVFRVVRDHGEELLRRLEMTPFAREEFEESYEVSEDPIENARRMIFRSFSGFGSGAAIGRHWRTGFRACSDRSGTTPAHDWRNYPDAIPAMIDRLRGVVIENRPALQVIGSHDREDALIYCDPPYVHCTRSAVQRDRYSHEMRDEDHREMAEALKQCKGRVVVSGYDCELYAEIFDGWRKEVNRGAHADGARDRVECLWMNFEERRLF